MWCRLLWATATRLLLLHRQWDQASVLSVCVLVLLTNRLVRRRGVKCSRFWGVPIVYLAVLRALVVRVADYAGYGIAGLGTRPLVKFFA